MPKLYAALDVSLNKTAVCIMDHDGRIVREVEVVTCPDAVAAGKKGGQRLGPCRQWGSFKIAVAALTATARGEGRETHDHIEGASAARRLTTKLAAPTRPRVGRSPPMPEAQIESDGRI